MLMNACSGTHCPSDPPVPPAEHGLKIFQGFNGDRNVEIGQTVDYKCQYRMRFVGDATGDETLSATCEDNDSWAEPTWKTCVTNFTCPQLPLPTNTTHPTDAQYHQYGDATVDDVGETFGPCLGRNVSNKHSAVTLTTEFPSCKNYVKVGEIYDTTMGGDNGPMGFYAELIFQSGLNLPLTVDLIFSHDIEDVANLDVEGAKSVAAGSRANIARVEMDNSALAALPDGLATVKGKHKYDGVEICLHDAVCYTDPTDLDSGLNFLKGTYDPATYEHNWNSEVRAWLHILTLLFHTRLLLLGDVHLRRAHELRRRQRRALAAGYHLHLPGG